MSATENEDKTDKKEALTPVILDDIIDRLLKFEYHKGYKIVDTNTNSSETAHLPYILKEKEIVMLI